MSLWLRQSTASQEIQLGKFVDDTDGKTAETALSIANTDIKLWVEGATSQTSKNSGGATHIANGYYYAVLDATDTATLGKMEVTVDVSGALAVRREYLVVPANVYDSIILGTDKLQIDAVEINSSTAAAVVQSTASQAVVEGTVTTGATTTSIPTSSLTPAASATDQFQGRVLIFTRDTSTAALRGQMSPITASTSGGTLTIEALSNAPASGDTFLIF
jgi:hypothetical protein